MAYFVRRDFFKSLTIASAFGIATVIAYVLEHEVTLNRGVVLAGGSVLFWFVLVILGRTLGWLVYTSRRDQTEPGRLYEQFIAATSVRKSRSTR